MTLQRYIWLALVGAAAAADIYLALKGEATLSQFIWQAAKAHPVIPFGAGFLAGHLFWRG